MSLLLRLYKWQRLYICSIFSFSFSLFQSPLFSLLSIACESEKFSFSSQWTWRSVVQYITRWKSIEKPYTLQRVRCLSFFFFWKFERTGFQCTLHRLACDIWEQMDLHLARQAERHEKDFAWQKRRAQLTLREGAFLLFCFSYAEIEQSNFSLWQGWMKNGLKV